MVNSSCCNDPNYPAPNTRIRLAVKITGQVQGVGFRPFLYNLAISHGVGGSVCNLANSVLLEIEGEPDRLAPLLAKVRDSPPPTARIDSLTVASIPLAHSSEFAIKDSSSERSSTMLSTAIGTDLAPCSECRKELFDLKNRRYLYPFISCASCGPRYALTRATPFDRRNTAMAAFPLCPACNQEFTDPGNRRFHAQTIGCWTCGPTQRLISQEGKKLARGPSAIATAAALLQRGQILALKGSAGFHLACSAFSHKAVAKIRAFKNRPTKPLAILVRDLSEARKLADLSAVETEALIALSAPIVIANQMNILNVEIVKLAKLVNPRLHTLGVMLPSTATQLLIAQLVEGPLIMTSGNLPGEPVIADNSEALQLLGPVADTFLIDNRTIYQPSDDAVQRCIAAEMVVIRPGRGLCPLVIPTPTNWPKQLSSISTEIVGLGALDKVTLSRASGDTTLLGPSLGDLSTVRARERFLDVINKSLSTDFSGAHLFIHDRHPDAPSHELIKSLPGSDHNLQHHYAHLLSCVLDRSLVPPIGGIIWDGSGYGEDGLDLKNAQTRETSETHCANTWGGEFILLDASWQLTRVASILPISLPGANVAIRDLRRIAVATLIATQPTSWRQNAPPHLLGSMRESELNIIAQLCHSRTTPRASSIGRLFDAAAALLGILYEPSYEGEGAVLLESYASRTLEQLTLPLDPPYLPILEDIPKNILRIDWRPLIKYLLDESLSVPHRAFGFHQSLAQTAAILAKQVLPHQVILSGGVFQNRLLSELIRTELSQVGSAAVLHRKVPPNDHGISVGQSVWGRLIAAKHSEEY